MREFANKIRQQKKGIKPFCIFSTICPFVTQDAAENNELRDTATKRAERNDMKTHNVVVNCRMMKMMKAQNRFNFLPTNKEKTSPHFHLLYTLVHF